MEGVFEYPGSRQDRWAAESDVRPGGYWYWDWSDEFQKVEKIDTRSKTVYLGEPFHYYGYRDSLHYFGLNLFCEIDRPGELYLKRSDGLLLLVPIQKSGSKPGKRYPFGFLLLSRPTTPE